MYKISCKMDKDFLRYSMFFHRGPTRPSPPPEIFKKAPHQIGLTLNKLPRKPVFKHVFTKLQGKMERNFYP